MRELPLLEGDGSLKADALGVALLVMSDPGQTVSELESASAVIQCDAKRMANSGGDVSRWTRQIGDDAASAAFAGTCAGEILLQYISLSLHRPNLATMNKCLELVWAEFANTKLNDGTRITTTSRSIQRYWKKYKSVAHLWAAKRLLQGATIDDPGHFFLVADALQKVALEHELAIGSDCWQLPHNYQRTPVSIAVPPPNDEALRVLEEYRAPKRRH